MRIRLVIVLLLFLFVGASVQAQIISVNCAEGSKDDPRANQTVLPDEIAGYGSYAALNWNNVQLDASGASLVDSTGAATGAVMTFNVAWGWGDGSADTSTGDGKIARGYFDDGPTTLPLGVDISVTDVPFTTYDVVLYLSSDYGLGFKEITVNGVSKITNPAADGDVAGWTGWIPDENMLVFSGITGDTLSISAPERWADGNPDLRGTIAGFQIVPEPASLVLLGLGTLAVVKRRRTRATAQ